MLKVTVTNGETEYDVEFTEEDVKVFLRHKSDYLAKISLGAAASALIEQFIYKRP